MQLKSLLPISLALILSTACGRPVIGITCGWSGSSNKVSQTYVNSAMKAGADVYLIPLVKDADSAIRAVKGLDGLILTGGEDIAPAMYGEEILNPSVDINAERDTSDILLIDAAYRKGIPILATCRGEQILNVYLGGTLYQDIPSQIEACLDHSQSEPGYTGTHFIHIEAESNLKHLLGKDSVLVNSFHHQCVKEPAEGLTVTARTRDGIIEAYEGLGVFAYQFHPEVFINKGNDEFLPIYTDFVKRAKSPFYKRSRQTNRGRRDKSNFPYDKP